mgnify:CR=1 FL=1
MGIAFDSLENGQAVHADIDGVPVAVVRIDDEVFAIHDKCSHADVRLSDGITREMPVDDPLIGQAAVVLAALYAQTLNP